MMRRGLVPAADSAALNRAELDRLETLLADAAFKNAAMRLDELQGLFCAVESGPERIPASRWLDAALGDEPDYASVEQMNEVAALLTRYCRQTAGELESGEPLSLLLYADDQTGAYDFAAWCMAYLRGAALSQGDWREAMGEEDFDELLGPMLALSGVSRAEAQEEGRRWLAADDEAALLDACRLDLPHAVKRVHRFWNERPAQS
jgi:yecA family protein